MVSRITNNMISRQVVENLQTNLRRLSKLQDQLSSSKMFSRPSDNPVDYAQALNLREILTGERRFVRNIERGINLLDLNDSTFGEATEVVQRSREIALTGINDTLDEDGRLALVAEAEELLQQIIQLSNTTSGEVSIYAGDQTDVIPFELRELNNIRTVVYRGDQGVREFQVGTGDITAPVLLDGVTAFLGDQGITTSFFQVADPTAALDTQLTGSPALTSGSFFLNGVQIDVDVTTDSLEDVAARINAADTFVNAEINEQNKLVFQSLHAFDVQIEDGTSNLMQNLGMYRRVYGESIGAAGSVTAADNLAGFGITPGGIRLTVGDQRVDVDLSGAVTFGDVYNAINAAGLSVEAYSNGDASGIDISLTETLAELKVEETSRVFGTAISAPGLAPDTDLASLGIATPLDEIEIVNNGISFTVDLSSANNISDVINLINTSDAGVTAEINQAATGLDIVAADQSATLQINEVGAGTTAADLGVLGADLEQTAADLGVNKDAFFDNDESQNIFKSLIQLTQAFSGQQDIDLSTDALNGLNESITLNNENRSIVGARTNRLELLQNRFTDSDLFLSQLISENEDIDLTKTITDLTTQETVLQTSLNSASRLLLPSLLDFLPI